jgi:hypothetical protein
LVQVVGEAGFAEQSKDLTQRPDILNGIPSALNEFQAVRAGKHNSLDERAQRDTRRLLLEGGFFGV